MKILSPVFDQKNIENQIIFESSTWDFVLWSKKVHVPCVSRSLQGIKCNPNSLNIKMACGLGLFADNLIGYRYYRTGADLGNLEWESRKKYLKSLEFSKNVRLVIKLTELVCITKSWNTSDKIVVFPGKYYMIVVEANQIINFIHDSETQSGF